MSSATMTASGKLLHPMQIFKGQAGGQIETREFQMYPDDCVYAFQLKAWMDKNIMNLWIDRVLVPWKNMKNLAIVPLLVLNAYRVHMMGSIVNCIQSLGIEMQHIPVGAHIYASQLMLE